MRILWRNFEEFFEETLKSSILVLLGSLLVKFGVKPVHDGLYKFSFMCFVLGVRNGRNMERW